MSLLSNQHPRPAEEEEDISRAGVYYDEPVPKQRIGGSRGKGKQRANDPFNGDGENDKEDGDGEGDGRESSEEYEEAGEKGYPPTHDDEAESRTVAEVRSVPRVYETTARPLLTLTAYAVTQQNLRRWEIAERQRRKAARDSGSTVASTSLVGDVTRKASLLWPGRRRTRQQAPPEGPGQHRQLRTSEDGVALDDMDTRLSAPPTPEPGSSPVFARASANPFLTPQASTVSLSLNSPDGDAIMHASDAPPRPALARADSVARQPPPPEPLDLPQPRSPPPRTETPHADRPPEPIAPPVVEPQEQEQEQPPKRWWTDWLCGCREDGDKQVSVL